MGFTAVDFAKPDASRFTFNPPPGTTVTESQAEPGPSKAAPHKGSADKAGAPRVVGKGWTSVVVASLPKDSAATAGAPGKGGAAAEGGDTAKQLEGIMSMLPKVSGSWGSGHLLQGTLFSVLVTDDGHVVAGAVQPDRLYAALAAK